MKAIFEFDLTNIDDQVAHMRAVQSLDMALAIWELTHNTKKSIEQQIDRALEEDKNFKPHDALDVVYDRIYKILNEHGINIDKLVV